ncbi:hypothetical protein [Nesterenkonia sandarakina]|uniref:Pyrroloquinoline-quinone binding quinoprotein n=1 Tax=Nesterenkonia sandarakina TaxID=272918 RepID=A0A2T0YB04_9MICC|nr:hypothetical protein [Nesterenkonia sandarakina]PRZ11867.1 hypothetical protein BCL67_1282 [Nesterenkonia sandarakina]
MSSSPHVHRRARITTLFGVLALSLGACSAEQSQDPTSQEKSAPPSVSIDPDPVRGESAAQDADLDDVHLPVHLTDLVSVDPQWDTPPQVHDGVFLAPGEQDGRLVFSAVAADGTVLWTAERPLSCSGFAMTSAGDRPLAVLTDLTDPGESAKSLGTTTATAYDLHTGEEVWGPVDVPGPHQGPGLVFAERGDEPLGGTGTRVALDAETGERVGGEADVIGEFYGTVVVTDDGDLAASTNGSSGDQWRVPAGDAMAGLDPEALISPATNRLPPGSALIGSTEDGYGLWDLDEGEILEPDLDDAMFDLMTQTWIALRDETLIGLDLGGEELWSADLGDEPQLLSAGGVMTYVLTEGTDLDIYNTVTGNDARVYDPLEEGETAIPLAFTEGAATVVDTGSKLLLVTDQPRAAADYEDQNDPLGGQP